MNKIEWRVRRTRAFVSGDYGGAPVDYLMAIAGTYTLMVVLVVNDLIGMALP